jgi:hypothetical protein
MKIVAIGDIHGRSIWKDIVAKEKYADKWVFMGDYFDSHSNGYSVNRQIENFKDILAFKNDNLDKVVLLFGNHCFHYLRDAGERYSGYQWHYAIDIGDIIHGALSSGLMQMCYKYDKYVFTHAGITKTWAAANDVDLTNIEQSVNDLFKYQPYRFRFTMGEYSNQSGDDITQTPIWVRPTSLKEDMIEGITYVVGHTPQRELMIFNDLILIDALGVPREYLVITDGRATKGKIDLEKS